MDFSALVAQLQQMQQQQNSDTQLQSLKSTLPPEMANMLDPFMRKELPQGLSAQNFSLEQLKQGMSQHGVTLSDDQALEFRKYALVHFGLQDPEEVEDV